MDADVVGRLVGAAGWREALFWAFQEFRRSEVSERSFKGPNAAAIRNRKSPAIGIGRRYFCEYICTSIFYDKGNLLRIDA